MPLDLVLTVLYLGTVAVAFRGGRPLDPDLPPDDQPPPAADIPLPRRTHLQRYVGLGLNEIDAYLADPYAPPADGEDSDIWP